MPVTNEPYNLSKIPSDFAGGADELSEPQKAQIRMTYYVLGGAAILLLVSGGAYIWAENGVANYADDVRALCANGATGTAIDFCKKYIEETFVVKNVPAKEVFEFCKNFIPPIVTLVLGAHYVTRNADSNT